MSIISANDGMLTNIEVLELIREIKSSRNPETKKHYDLLNRDNIENQVTTYLQRNTKPTDNYESNTTCLHSLKELRLDLTMAEELQLLNHMPEYAVEIHLIVEECAERYTEDQVEDIIEQIKSRDNAS